MGMLLFGEQEDPIGGLSYCFDIVMLIDATESMRPILDKAKANAKNFCDKFCAEMEEHDKYVEELRIKIIPFRDYKYDGESAMADSGFFTLPAQNKEFGSYLDSIEARGGGDGPGNALEALALAMQSDWTTQGIMRRHIILLFTDADAVPLGDQERTISPYYPANMPASLEELDERWCGESQELGMPDPRAARLVVFAPKVQPWDKMQVWNKGWTFFVSPGRGLGEIEFDMIIDLLASSSI